MGSPNGYLSGFVRFSNGNEAQNALAAIENRTLLLHGAPIAAKWADKNSRPTSGLGVSVGHVSVDPSMQQQMFLTGEPSRPHASQPADGFALGEELTTIWVGNAMPTTL